MKSNTKVILHFGNDELILEDDKISDFNSGLSSGTDFIKIGTVYINRNAITHFEVLTENEENDEDTDLSQWDFLSGDYSKY